MHRGLPGEIVDEFSNGGSEWHPTEPTRPQTHDFVDKELGRAVPYGAYDRTNDEGWVSVGDTADTAETATFAVEATRQRWSSMGSPRFLDAIKLLITADAGGSNGYRVKLWEVELVKLSEETGLQISVCHYHPGTSTWNKIEHKMCRFISMNWRGTTARHLPTIIELISATITTKGLTIRAEEDLNYYQTGTRVTNAELVVVPLNPSQVSTVIGPTPSLNQTIGEP
ncbi:MAG: ISAzo13 family transposase [Acidimicrobiales bacterium]